MEGAYVDLQKVYEVFNEQKAPTPKSEMGTKSERLNGRKITLLASSLSFTSMEVVAKKYLNINHEAIQNLKYKTQKPEASTRNVIRYWAHKNPGPDQVKVTCILLFTMAAKCQYITNILDINLI